MKVWAFVVRCAHFTSFLLLTKGFAFCYAKTRKLATSGFPPFRANRAPFFRSLTVASERACGSWLQSLTRESSQAGIVFSHTNRYLHLRLSPHFQLFASCPVLKSAADSTHWVLLPLIFRTVCVRL